MGDDEHEPEQPEAPEQPKAPDELAATLDRERAERLRLEGENRQLREQIDKAKPSPPDQPPLTPEDVEKALNQGEVTQAQAARLFARIEARRAAESMDSEREQHAVLNRANEKIAGYVQENPDLRDRSSPLMQRVAQELRVVHAEYGMNPDDPRSQLLAIERAVGVKGNPMPDDREYDRLRRGGGVGGFDAGDRGDRGRRSEPPPKSRGERIFNQLLPEFQSFYISLRGSKEAAVKTLEHADEAGLRKAGRLA